MLSITLPTRQIKRLEEAAKKASRKLPSEVAAAVNATARKAKTQISREIRRELAAPAKAVNKALRQTRKAKRQNPSAVLTLEKSRRIPLRDFGARQNKTGVSVRISKRAGRKTIPGAFQGPKPGAIKASWQGNVFKRVGRSRLPIRKLKGPSPWGVFREQKLSRQTVRFIKKELRKQLERRIRFNVLKASGAI